MKRDKVVVTGGMGFIGRSVTELLYYNGCDVHVIDDYSTQEGKEFNFPYNVISYKRGAIRSNEENAVKVHVNDIKDQEATPRILKDARFVFHLAAWPRVEPSIKDPVTYHEVNVTNSLKLFKFCADAGVERVVFSSSSSVYGNPTEVPTKEDHPFDPMCPYALNKAHGESYLELFSKLYELNSVSLRYFNVYGEGQPTKGAYVPVMGIFFRQKVSGEALTVTGDGSTKRDFVNVKDVAVANVQAALAELPDGHHAFNVGTGKSYSILDIAKSVDSNVTNIAPRFEPAETCADISKAKELLNWRPKFNLMDWISENKPK